MNPESRQSFIERTIFNLNTIEKIATDDGPFEVTQLINSFLLVVLQNWDDLKETWPHLSKGSDWPRFESSHPNWQPHQQVVKFRDALAHGCFTVTADHAAKIGEIHLWTCTDPENVDWHASLTVQQMRAMLVCFSDVAKRFQQRCLEPKRKGQPSGHSRRRPRREAMSSLRSRDFKGSRNRCLMVTNEPDEHVRKFLNQIAPPKFIVNEDDRWWPKGYPNPQEAKLGETDGLLSEQQKELLTNWWLSRTQNANTPNWDLVSTCRYGDRQGLIIIEAKAHESEFSDGGCGAKNAQNSERIRCALQEATDGLSELMTGFSLSFDRHFQLSNRFAFAWKLATMGIPVALIYLGFLDAWDMVGSGRQLLRTHEDWSELVILGSAKRVPSNVWNSELDVKGTPLAVAIRSARFELNAVRVK